MSLGNHAEITVIGNWYGGTVTVDCHNIIGRYWPVLYRESVADGITYSISDECTQ